MAFDYRSAARKVAHFAAAGLRQCSGTVFNHEHVMSESLPRCHLRLSEKLPIGVELHRRQIAADQRHHEIVEVHRNTIVGLKPDRRDAPLKRSHFLIHVYYPRFIMGGQIVMRLVEPLRDAGFSSNRPQAKCP